MLHWGNEAKRYMHTKQRGYTVPMGYSPLSVKIGSEHEYEDKHKDEHGA